MEIDMEEVIISNPNVEKIKSAIKKDGADNLHILADFDRTLIKAFVNGESVSSVISILYNENHLTPDYGPKAQELHKKYQAIELDPKIPKEEKKKAMYEWWTKHFDLLIKSGLNKKDIENIVNSGKIVFRDGFPEFIELLRVNNIPLVIMSSSGLGGDSVRMCLEREKKLYNNIYIISNSFEWDKNGRAISVKQPIIYGMNKDETMIKNYPEIFEKIKNRKNVILLGDSLDDVGMVTGFNYNNLIKIGFLNNRTEENLENYKNHASLKLGRTLNVCPSGKPLSKNHASLKLGRTLNVCPSGKPLSKNHASLKLGRTLNVYPSGKPLSKKTFDVVILNDGSLEFINNLLKEII